MKRSALLASLLLTTVSTTVFAQERMNSLSYRTEAGEFHFDTGLKFNRTEEKDLANDKTEVKTTKWDLGLTYGLTNEFSFGVGFFVPVNTDVTFAGQDSRVEFKGISDIALKSSYRYMNSDIKGDLLVGLNVSKTRKQELAGSTLEVDTMTGGHSLELGTQIAGEMGAFEWATSAKALYNFEKKLEITVPGEEDTDKTKAYVDFNVGVAGQYNLMPTMSLGLNATVNFNGKEESKTDGTGTKAYTDVVLGVNYKYQIVENFMLGVSYQTSLAVDTKDLTGAVDTKDMKESECAFNISYRF